ncbi:hypothetical protein JTB14_032504 [Gonioctena quinquepunctata]|nr:hypothetical protein JTB14_032504 [Gonioctena quinquepunctata]
MENVCKPTIDEKHYTYSRITETNIRNDNARTDVRQVDCGKKKNGFGFSRKVDEPPPPTLLLIYFYSKLVHQVGNVSPTILRFNTGGSSNQESGKVTGSLETKYKVKDVGITFSEKWNTDNTLGTEIAVQDELLKGLKLSGNVNFSPQTGYKSAGVKSAFVNERVALNADVDLDSNGPIIGASAVVGYHGWLAGYQAAFDVQNTKLKKSNFALGFNTIDFVLVTSVVDGQEFGGSIYQKISPKLESAIQLAWSAGSNNTKFGIGAKYNLDQDAALRAKINNASQIGLGYQQRLREGVTLTLSALIDGKNFNNGGHKIGLALELEA